MGRQSSRIWYRGKDHKDIYFQGHYHKAMYLGSQLVWEKLSDYDLYPIPDGDLWFYNIPKIIRSNGEVDYYLDYNLPSNSHAFTLIKVYPDGTEQSLILEDSDSNFYPQKSFYAKDGIMVELFYPTRKEFVYNFFYHYKMVDTSTMSIVDSGTVESYDYDPDAFLYNDFYMNDFEHPYSFNLEESGGVYRTTGGISIFSYKQGSNVYCNRYIGILTFNTNIQEHKAYDFLRDIPNKFGRTAPYGAVNLRSYKVYENTGLGINDYLYLTSYASNNKRVLAVFNTGTAEMTPITTAELKYESEEIPVGHTIIIHEEIDSVAILSRSDDTCEVFDISQYPFAQIGDYQDYEVSTNDVSFSLMPSKDSMGVNTVDDPKIQDLATNRKKVIYHYYYYPDNSYLYVGGIGNFLDDTHFISRCNKYNSSGRGEYLPKPVHIFRLSTDKRG